MFWRGRTRPSSTACALRKQIADDAGMPPYIVFSDKTLKGMVRLRPQTEEELLQVSGVGQKKLASYGEAFLKELQAERSHMA